MKHNVIVSPIKSYDIQLVVQQRPNNKSPGGDGIPFEFYKTFWSVIGETVVELKNFILNKEEIPHQMETAIGRLLPKKSF